MKLKNLKDKNLLDLFPIKLVESEVTEDGKINLLFPRFKNKILFKIFVNDRRSPYIKANLDDFGSEFWRVCDGKTNVFEIGKKMKEKFGEKIDPVYERLQVFIVNLRRNGFIDLEEYSK